MSPSWEIRNSEVGGMSCEIPLSAPFLTANQFAPYRSDWALYRSGASQQFKLITEGVVTSTNLVKDRDTILVAGKDWLHLLERRIFPFDPVAYKDMVTLDSTGKRYFEYWPWQWPNPAGNPVEVRDIVQDMLLRVQQTDLNAIPGVAADAPGTYRGSFPLVLNNVPTGTETKYTIFPGDQTAIYDHIRKLSEQVDGFEFDIIPITREFKMWSPGRDGGVPVYQFQPTDDEATGAITEVDWTNDGPEGTVIVGLGTADHRKGAIWYYKPSVDLFRWLDKIYDFGEISNDTSLFQMVKDQNDLFPQKKLAITLLNPEFLDPSFYTANRPRSLIGNRVSFEFNWIPYWHVNADFKVNAISCATDPSGNEDVDLELEMVYEEGGIGN